MTKPDTASAARRRRSDRELAKLGMTAALGLLVITGFTRDRTARGLHVLAGGALVGLSVWHHLLYSSGNDKAADRGGGDRSA